MGWFGRVKRIRVGDKVVTRLVVDCHAVDLLGARYAVVKVGASRFRFEIRRSRVGCYVVIPPPLAKLVDSDELEYWLEK